MPRRIRELDWASTTLGAPRRWPRSLRSAVQIALGSRSPMFVGWGRELTHLYNDACIPLLGRRHPEALSRPAREVWHDVWDVLGTQTEAVLDQGHCASSDDCFLALERSGHPEEAYFGFSCSPLLDDAGNVGGLLCVSTETTQRVLGQRRLATLRELASWTSAAARNTEAACQAIADALAENPRDMAFALVYLREGEGVARLAAATGLAEGSPARASRIDLGTGARTWPLGDVLSSRRPAVVKDVDIRFGALAAGAWPEPVHTAVALPLSRQDRVVGFIVVGMGPRVALDEDYLGFCDLLASHGAAALASATAPAAERMHGDAARSAADEDIRALLAWEREQRAAAERASVRKDDFLTAVSHEMRTPINTALLWLEMLRERRMESGTSPDADTFDRGLVAIERSIKAQMRLTEDLLDLSRIDAGKLRLERDLIDLGDLIQLAVEVQAPLAREKEIELVTRLEEPRSIVRGDGMRLEQVLWNLLSNAIKFTQQGGRVQVSLERGATECVVRVRDDGQGIDASVLPHIFERFRQVEGPVSRPRMGLGLGLAIVQQLVEAHGGSARAASEGVGRGSTFSVSLPLARDPYTRRVVEPAR